MTIRIEPQFQEESDQGKSPAQINAFRNKSWFGRFFSKLREKRLVKPPVEDSARQPVDDSIVSNLYHHNDDILAFRLDWRILREGQKQRIQSQAIKDGYTHFVEGVDIDLVGYLKLPETHRKSRSIYSAALALAETVSLGGEEIFVFRVDENRHALVALKNSMPVPGFDLVGDMGTIFEAAQSYLSLPHKNEVRRCGDAELLSGAEFFDLNTVLNGLDRGQPRVRAIPDVRTLLIRGAILAGIGLVLLIGWLGWTYFKAKEAAERLKLEGDPNIQYERQYENASSAVRGLGESGLKAMTAALYSLPTEINGWGLTGVTCTLNECRANWARLVGNFNDFDRNIPGDVSQKPEYGFISGDSKGLQLKTTHAVAFKKGETVGKLKREELPVVPFVQSDFVSQLQDYSLIDAKVQVSAPSPFPSGVSDISQIFRPVVSGGWSMELPLWAIDSLTLPAYVSVETLSVDLPSKIDGDKGVRTFKLTGKYYAKGKNF